MKIVEKTQVSKEIELRVETQKGRHLLKLKINQRTEQLSQGTKQKTQSNKAIIYLGLAKNIAELNCPLRSQLWK